MLKHVYGSEILSWMQSLEWHRRFREDRETAEDDDRCGPPNIYFLISSALCIWNLSLKGKFPEKKLYVDSLFRLRMSFRKKATFVAWAVMRTLARKHFYTPIHDFYSKTKPTVLPHPPYSPDFSSWDFFLFPYMLRRL